MDDIICIGTANDVEVNAYHTHVNKRQVPIIEILCNGRIAMTLAQTEGVIDLLQEAMTYWHEEACETYRSQNAITKRQVVALGSPTCDQGFVSRASTRSVIRPTRSSNSGHLESAGGSGGGIGGFGSGSGGSGGGIGGVGSGGIGLGCAAM